MRIQSNKLYIDYLDHTVSGSVDFEDLIVQLKFDLLLFSEDTLCMSVPACVKLDATTDVLMKLTPFWKNGKLKLILDHKHQNNPWNYFNNRKRKLEKGFSEQDLLQHFEYIAYTAPRTDYFYNTFIRELVDIPKAELYLDKIFDTDETFRQSVITQIYENSDVICRSLPLAAGLHMGKIFNDLLGIAKDRKALFQRIAIEKKLIRECNATSGEMKIVSKMLDRGFAYANGVSSYAAPISLVTNRLTGKTFVEILRAAEPELLRMIQSLSWPALYRLSTNDIWADFIDHLNKLLLLYQGSKRHKDALFNPAQIEASLGSRKVILKIYETAIQNFQIECLKAGAMVIEVVRIKEYADKFIENYFYYKKEYWDIIRGIDEIFPAIKVAIRSIDRKHKDSTLLLKDQGYIICLNRDIL